MLRHLPQPVVHKHHLQNASVGVHDRLVADGAPEHVRAVRKREGVLHKLLEDHATVHAFAEAVQHVDYVKLGKGLVASPDAFSYATRRIHRYSDDETPRRRDTATARHRDDATPRRRDAATTRRRDDETPQ